MTGLHGAAVVVRVLADPAAVPAARLPRLAAGMALVEALLAFLEALLPALGLLRLLLLLLSHFRPFLHVRPRRRHQANGGERDLVTALPLPSREAAGREPTVAD